MKEKILSKIHDVQRVLDSSVYPLNARAKSNYGFYYYFDVLEFIIYAKQNHHEEYEYYNEYGTLTDGYDTIDDFGHTYVKVFDVQPRPIRFDSGILGIYRPIEDMITEFYEHIISMSEAEILAIRNNTSAVQVNDCLTTEKVWGMFQEINNKVTDVHGALFKKEKTKKDKAEVIEAGIRLRLLRK